MSAATKRQLEEIVRSLDTVEEILILERMTAIRCGEIVAGSPPLAHDLPPANKY